MKLTLEEQKKVLRALTDKQMEMIKKCCSETSTEQKGNGVIDIIKKIRKKLTPLIPILKVVGDKALKEVIIPLLIKKAKEQAGLGLALAGRPRRPRQKMSSILSGERRNPRKSPGLTPKGGVVARLAGKGKVKCGCKKKSK